MDFKLLEHLFFFDNTFNKEIRPVFLFHFCLEKMLRIGSHLCSPFFLRTLFCSKKKSLCLKKKLKESFFLDIEDKLEILKKAKHEALKQK